MGTWARIKDRLIDVGLGLGMIFCVVMLGITAGSVMMHVVIGIAFTVWAAYTVVRGQTAVTTTEKMLWFMATGFTAFLFLYWSFTFVFRPPKNQNSVGCGGVQFIHKEEL
jgi:hypothetical protein